MKLVSALGLCIAASVLMSCNQMGKVATDETPTRGKIKIGVDDSYKLLIDTQVYTFGSLYTGADITPLYKSELDVLDDFMKDSVRLMVTSRTLSKDEVAYLTGKQLVARTTKIAYDAIALIINNDNPDSLMKYNTVADIFKGKTDSWKKIYPKSKLDKIKVVFDNVKSSNVRFIVEKLQLPKTFPSYCAAVNTNEEVVNYVEKHPNAIGLISVNWISDRQDSVSHSFLKKVRVLAISNEIEPDGPNYYRPYQGFVADKSYPFIRDVYVTCRESFSGLGSGFASFLAGEKGQRIILKAGMVPAVMPVRLVQIKSN